jgi:hypothetical protein
VPPPADLRDYEAILPGAADRILNLAVLVGVFVYGTATRRAERLQKAKMMRPPGEQN